MYPNYQSPGRDKFCILYNLKGIALISFQQIFELVAFVNSDSPCGIHSKKLLYSLSPTRHSDYTGFVTVDNCQQYSYEVLLAVVNRYYTVTFQSLCGHCSK